MQTQTYRCPNCQTELSEPLPRCPLCGMALDHRPESAAFTKVPVLDGILGTLSGLVLIFTGLGIGAGIFLYVQYKKRYPYFCMGLVLSAALVALLLLGLFLVCLGSGGR